MVGAGKISGYSYLLCKLYAAVHLPKQLLRGIILECIAQNYNTVNFIVATSTMHAVLITMNCMKTIIGHMFCPTGYTAESQNSV